MARTAKRKMNDGKQARGTGRQAIAHVADDDGLPPPKTPPVSFGWRMKPDDSLSDWTIEIVSERADEKEEVVSKTDTYHVHKCHLATGAQKSGYFAKLFSEGGRFSETQESKSRIVLNELAAKAFPDLLDYLYGTGSSPKITTDNSTALSFLAKYFDMPYLRWALKEFWANDVKDPAACGTYYEHAKILQEEKILCAAVRACSDNILRIETTSRLLHVHDSAFWVKLVESSQPADSDSIHRSRQLSKLIAALCRNVPVDKETFQKLTNTRALPQIDVEAALMLLDAERQIMAQDGTALTPLQERCIDAFARNENRIDLLQQAETLDALRNQNSLVLSELFVRSLKSAAQNNTRYGGYGYVSRPGY